MATKIQLRRDYAANWQATNPTLSLGEPGVELDTHAIKVGDGITAWNDLAYVQSNTDPAKTTENMFVKLNGMYGDLGPEWAGTVSVSTDGLNWTPSTYNHQESNNQRWDVLGLAVGGGRIVYTTYEYAQYSNQSVNRSELRWAYNAFEIPQKPTTDNVRRGPKGENIEWWNVRYANGYFVAVGSYYDLTRDNYRYPVAVYSTDGDNWTNISIDLAYAQTLIEAERGAHSNDVTGIAIGDVAYGNGGWLFTMNWDLDYTSITRNPAGAFYITAITTALNSSTRIGQIPGGYIAHFDGHGWVAWANYNAATGGPAAYFNSNSDPRIGSWRTVDLREVFRAINGDNYPNCTADVAAGKLGDTDWVVFSDGYYGVYATSDQGVTWKILQTTPEVMAISHIDNTTPVQIEWEYGNVPNNGETVTIAGSPVAGLNGTFHTLYDGGVIKLYHDVALTQPVAALGSHDLYVNISVTGNYGDHTVVVNDASGLVVGMISEGYNALTSWEANSKSDITGAPNKIVSIDGNNVTMQFPFHGINGHTYTIGFQAVLYRSYGDGIGALAYGDGAFIGMSWNNLERAYKTTDLNSWQSTTLGNGAQNSWVQTINQTNSVTYGTVTTHGALLRTNSNTVPGYTNYLSVSDTFQMNVAAGDPQWTDDNLSSTSGFGQGTIQIDPTVGLWAMGVSMTGVEGYSGYFETGIATYNDGTTYQDYNHIHNSVEIHSEGYTWYFDNDDGYLFSQRLSVGDNEGQDNSIYGDSVLHGIYFYDEASNDSNNSDQFVERGIYVNNGTFVIDSASGTGLPNTPNFTTSVPFEGGGSIEAGTYHIYIVAYDYNSNQAYPSNYVNVTTTGTDSRIFLQWPSYSDNALKYVYNQELSFYRIYFSSGSVSQRYIQIDGNMTEYTMYNTSGTIGGIQFVDHTGNGEGSVQIGWDDDTNYTRVDYYGTHISTEGHHWDFSGDCNDDNWGVLYNPESTNIQIPGYWKIGDYFEDWTGTYIKASNYSNYDPGDIEIRAEGPGGEAAYYFDRHGVLTFDYGDGVMQSTGYWAVGDYQNNDSYTYIGATDNVDPGAYDITVVADNTVWYFNRDGRIQLPVGGDIVDHNYVSVLNKDMPQNKVTSGDVTLTLTDRGGHIYNTGTGNVKVPTNESVAFPIGTVITVISADNAFAVVPVSSGTTTIIVSNSGPSTSVPIPANTYTTMLKIDTDRWIIERAS